MRNYISHKGTITFFENGFLLPEQVPDGASVYLRPGPGWTHIPQIRGDYDQTPTEQIYAALKQEMIDADL